MFVAVDGAAAGVIAVADRVKESSIAAVGALASGRIRTLMERSLLQQMPYFG